MAKHRLGMNGTFSMNCDLAGEVEIAGKLGYDYVELRDSSLLEYLKGHELAELCSTIAAARIATLAFNTIEPTTLGPGEDRQRLVASAGWHAKQAAALGCPYIVTCAWMGPDADYSAPVYSEDEGYSRVVEGLRLISDVVADYPVKVAYEPVASKVLPVHTIADTMRLLEEVDRENIGWLLDIYHFHVADGSLASLEAADVSKLLLVHMDDPKDLPYERLALPHSERTFPGDGVSNLPAILSTLSRLGYQGPFSLELINSEFMAWDAYEFAKTAKEKTEAVLDRYFK